MLTFTITAILLLAIAVAGWPLVLLRRLRPALQLTGGSCCVAAGATVMGLLAAGLIAVPGAEMSPASAQEKAAGSSAEPASDSHPAAPAESTPAASSAAAAPASAESAAAAATKAE
ncbi:MAG: hypothetical protein L0211_20305, partial [Planctomycetaceae bacterium]|nr:hypothetical protein [Planctomycetaceae bacterium]